MYIKTLDRREFLKNASLAMSVPLFLGCRGDIHAQRSGSDVLAEIKRNAQRMNGPGAWTGAADVPETVSWNTALASPTDQGQPITISGTIYRQNGTTPAPSILIYLYHTDIYGHYGRRSDEHRHGRYRGWMLTDARGRYEFRSIKPASYPDSTTASHIHMTVTGSDFREDWVDSILFEGDRFLTANDRKGERGGFNHVLKMEKGSDGILRGVRNIMVPA